MKTDVDRLRDVVSRRFGLALAATDPTQLEALIRRRARGDTRAYLDRLEADPPEDELMALAGEVTIGETYFFRHGEQFRAFAEIALADRLRSRQPPRRLQILSAGCATGEEAYSLAVVAAEHGVRQVSVLGVDLNPASIARAVRGRYGPWAFRDTPPELRARWFQKDGSDVVVSDALREVVRFEPWNLTTGAWRDETFDVVFFRNVMMYFTLAKAQTVVGHLARALAPGGWFFLGHAETLRGISNDFHLHHTHGTFYYQRREGEASQPPPPEPRAPASTPPVAPPPSAATGLAWVEQIGRASERITRLEVQRPPERVPTPDLALASRLFAEERFDAALAAIPADTAHPAALLLTAVIHVQAGRPQAAVALGRRLLALDELDADAHHVLSMCHAGVGDRSAAIDEDQIAAYLDPGFAMARLHLGLLADQAGDRASARRELAAAQTLLAREEIRRINLFGGGFGREALLRLCRDRLRGRAVSERLRSAERLREEFDRAFALPYPTRQNDAEHLLVIAVAEQTFALRLTHVDALVAQKPVTTLPGPVPTLRGIAGFRGQLVPVYDLAALLGYPTATKAPWLVLVGGGDGLVALAFAGYHGHRRVAPTSIAAASAPGSFARERYQEGDTSAAVVDLPRVVATLRGKGSR